MFSSLDAIRMDLRYQKQLKERYLKKLDDRKQYQGLLLDFTVSKGHRYYYAYQSGSTKRLYLGSEKSETLNRIRETHFAQEAVQRTNQNILLLQTVLDQYQSCDPRDILNSLPKSYRLNDLTLPISLNERASKWLEEKQRWKASFPVKDPDNLTVVAFDGTPMRSRIENLEYDAFYIHSIPCIYECPLEIESVLYYPDFTLLRIEDFRVFLWEHLGLWYDPVRKQLYRRNTLDKFDAYASIGFYPEQNLLLSFETPDGNLDLSILHQKLDGIFGPTPHTANRRELILPSFSGSGNSRTIHA